MHAGGPKCKGCVIYDESDIRKMFSCDCPSWVKVTKLEKPNIMFQTGSVQVFWCVYNLKMLQSSVPITHAVLPSSICPSVSFTPGVSVLANTSAGSVSIP